MKKSLFFKFFLFAVIGTMVTVTSCKDYDDDIDHLQDQITSLQGVSTELEAIKSDVAAAKSSANDALAKANEALEAAQSSGDADAIAEAQEAADKAQAKADEVETKATELEGLIEALEVRVATLEALDSPSKEDLEALDADMKEIVQKLEALFGKNLRSLVLIPHYYVNSVEAIGFNPLRYTCAEKDTLANPNYVTVQYHVNPSSVTKDMIDVDNLSFVYRLQENKTRSTDINAKAEFVSLVDGILTVKVDLDANKAENGGLDYNNKPSVEKMDMLALQVPLSEKAKEDDADYEAVITSDWARVDVEPMTDSAIDRVDALCKKDEITYSDDYAALAEAKENQTKPYLLELVFDQKHHLSDYITATAVLDACGEYDPADYGLVWNFDLLDEEGKVIKYELTDNKTDQQKFIKVLDDKKGTIEAKVYDADEDSGVSASIGRTPIVRVQLIDPATECVVNEGFVKIKWVKDQGVFDATYPAEDVDFSCDKVEGEEYSVVGVKVKTEWMNENVLNAMGTYYKEFIKDYTIDDTTLYDDKGVALDWGTVVPNPEATSTSEVTDLFNVHLDDICGLKDNSTFTGYVHFTENVDDEVALRVKVTLNVNMPDLTVAGYNNTYWQGGNNTSGVFKVSPVQYGTDAQNGVTTAMYRTDLLNGFTNGTTYTDDIAGIVKSSVKDHTPCGVKFVFDAEALEEYTFEIGEVTYVSTGDTANMQVSEDGKKLQFNNGTNWVDASEIKLLTPMPGLTNNGEAIHLTNNDFGKALIGETVPVKLAAELCCDTDCDDLSRDIRSFEVYFIPPMHINSTFTESFTDYVIGGDYINLDKAFTLTDFVDYLVAKTTPTTPTEKQKYASDLWDYYELGDAVWDVDGATCNIANVDGNLDVVPGAKNALPSNYLVSYEDTATNENSLKFQNNSGAPLAKDFELYVPVTVGHKWGTLSTVVTIKVESAPEL